jgi:hypothetical protein
MPIRLQNVGLIGIATECIAAAEMVLEWKGFVSCIEKKCDRRPDEMNFNLKLFPEKLRVGSHVLLR